MLRYQDYRQHVEQLAQAALSAANPARAVRRFMHCDGRDLVIGDLVHNLDQGRVYVVSVGKAAAPMAEATIQILGDDLRAAIVVLKYADCEVRSDRRCHEERARIAVRVGSLGPPRASRAD